MASKKLKFSSKMDATLLEELREFAQESKRPIADVISDAVAQHLNTVRVRPIFKSAADEVIAKNADLLKRLAR